METDTILLSVAKYNELYDVDKAVKAGKRLVIREYYGMGGGSSQYFYTDDEILNEIRDREIKAVKENEKLKAELEELRWKMPQPKTEPTLDEIKLMSYWQFRKWKNS